MLCYPPQLCNAFFKFTGKAMARHTVSPVPASFEEKLGGQRCKTRAHLSGTLVPLVKRVSPSKLKTVRRARKPKSPSPKRVQNCQSGRARGSKKLKKTRTKLAVEAAHRVAGGSQSVSSTISETASCVKTLDKPCGQFDLCSTVVAAGSAGVKPAVLCARGKRGRGRGSKRQDIAIEREDRKMNNPTKETSQHDEPNLPAVAQTSDILTSSSPAPTEETDLAIFKPPSVALILYKTETESNTSVSSNVDSASYLQPVDTLPKATNQEPATESLSQPQECGDIDMEYPMPSTSQQKMARQLARQRQLEAMRAREAALAREERLLRRQGLLNPRVVKNSKQIKWKEDGDLVEVFTYLPTDEDVLETEPLQLEPR